MTYEVFHKSFISCLSSLIPNRKELIDYISQTLYIDKRAASRRLQGDYQFRINEILQICSHLDISLDKIILKEGSKYHPFSLMYYPFNNLSDKEYSFIYKWLDKYKIASKEESNYALISTNILPDIFCFQYENLIRFYKVKWAYYMDNLDAKNYMEDENVLEPAYFKAIREYINIIFEFKTLLIIWDYNIIPSLIQDIEYFTNIGYLTSEHRARIKKELFLLINQLDMLCKNCIPPDSTKIFTFAISSIHLNKTHTVFKGNDFKVSVDSAFYTTYLYVKDPRIVESVEHIILSTLKSSVIISQSNEKERLKFIEQQRILVETI